MTTKRSSRPIERKKKSTEPRPVSSVFLGLGSNLGDPEDRLNRALVEISRLATVRRLSSFYLTDPVGFSRQPRFWNAVAEIGWSGTPRALLTALKKIERRLGRQARFRNGPREIDIDILDFGGLVRVSPDPVLPHPRLSGRRFVLEPLAEIAPGWRHPESGEGVRELLARVARVPRVKRIRR